MMRRIDYLEKTIANLGYKDIAIVQERQNNKDLYKKDYKDHHTTLFKKKRADTVKNRYGLDGTTAKELL
ncbi:hypothetical protein KBC03_02720 [Patescibacteria group bacterium]|nr:hypothetical protein [Patescibacteria group bacterium]